MFLWYNNFMGSQRFFAKGKSFNSVEKTSTYRARILMAESPETKPEILSRLAEDGSEEVKTEVAGNLKTPAEALNRLSKDKSMWVKVRLAGNIKLPLEAIIRLSKDTSAWVRGNIAVNPSTPVEILSQMLSDASVGVIDSLASNPNTPYEMLMSDEVLHKIGTIGALNIFKREEFNSEAAVKIIYGDYPEHVIRAAAESLPEDEVVKTYTVLKYGKNKPVKLDYDRFAV
jgi:hypothetical protein